MVCVKQNIEITEDGIDTIWRVSNGDMRKVMHILQIISINHNKINSDTVTTFKKYPSNDDSLKIYKILKKCSFNDSINKVSKIIDNCCYSVGNIITVITHRLIDDIINNGIKKQKAVYILQHLREIEVIIPHSTNTHLHISHIVSVFIKGMNVDTK